ncbi:helix-turn-helix domain-containing protein [Dolosigranulum pigrum]|uniref:helix-turn-helix domain-containing protein n=1 Tax=Dolosigranulum pigrum TaxID=29394 RepID=UPI001AD88034|nr:helix-turn-helix domain-containing protein [Dolosigranulum pigrum]QTJ57514.1 HTH domain-containing protein [Dolosigranulum pigrum]
MKEILRPADIRRLDLLKILNDPSKAPIQLADLADIFEVSERTIREDIAFYKNELAEMGTIYYTNEGVGFHCSTEANKAKIQQLYLTDNNHFRILSYIFEQGGAELEDIVDEFFLTSGYSWRLLRKVSDRLSKKFDVNISRSPVDFIGDERHIRFIWAQYLYESEEPLDWEKLGIDEAELDDFLWYFVKALDVSIQFISFTSFKIYTYVNIQRYKQGNIVDPQTMNTENYLNQLFDNLNNDPDKIQELKDMISRVLNIPFSIEMTGQIFHNYMQSEYCLNYDDLISNIQSNEKYSPLLLNLDSMLYKLKKEFEIELPNKFDVILELHNATHSHNIDLGSNYLLIRHNHYFCNHMEKIIPFFYERAKELIRLFINQYHSSKKMDTTLHSYLMYTLIVNWQNLLPQLLKKTSSLKFLIINHHNTRHSSMLSDLFTFCFRQSVEFDSIEYLELSWKDINLDDYNIILTTKNSLSLDTTTPILHINDMPTKYEFHSVATKISELLSDEENRL